MKQQKTAVLNKYSS